MGIERIVSDDMVFEVADQLTAKGEKVTNRAVWSAIGGGSMTTISQALRRWRERQELRSEQPIERAPLPAAIADAMHDAVSRLWMAAQEETKAELDQLAQATNARVSETQNERDEALAELQATAEELELVKIERDEAMAEIERQAQQLLANTDEHNHLNSIIEQYAKASDEATHRAETTESARVELQARVAQLTDFLERVQTERQALQVMLGTLMDRISMAKDKSKESEQLEVVDENALQWLDKEAVMS